MGQKNQIEPKHKRSRKHLRKPNPYWELLSLLILCSSLGKLPKNCDPKSTPDPERWLPMRERSYYRGRKKGKKKEQVGRGTQGATSGASAEL